MILKSLSLSTLATLHNGLVEVLNPNLSEGIDPFSPVTKFKDKSTGARRVEAILHMVKTGRGMPVIRVTEDGQLIVVSAADDVETGPMNGEAYVMSAKVAPALAPMTSAEEAIQAQLEQEDATADKPAKRGGRTSPMLSKNIQLVRAANPKRPGSRTFARYALYEDGMDAARYMHVCLEANLGSRREILSDLAWDASQHFIHLV